MTNRGARVVVCGVGCHGVRREQHRDGSGSSRRRTEAPSTAPRSTRLGENSSTPRPRPSRCATRVASHLDPAMTESGPVQPLSIRPKVSRACALSPCDPTPLPSVPAPLCPFYRLHCPPCSVPPLLAVLPATRQRAHRAHGGSASGTALGSRESELDCEKKRTRSGSGRTTHAR